mgnify:CR=1 FL=1
MARRYVAASAAGLVLVLSVAGCAPVTTEAGPTDTASGHASSDPTETTMAPQAPVFSGTINFERFMGDAWASMDRVEKVDACNEEFFVPNLPDDPALTVTSSPQEITKVFLNRELLLEGLARDTSDDRNLDAAQNIAECLTTELTVNGSLQARTNLRSWLSSIAGDPEGALGGFKMKPEGITRHSDGLFAAQTSDNLYYDAYAIEGYLEDELGRVLRTHYYEWSPAEYQFTLMLESPIDDENVKSHFGTKPPIVVDPARADAPVADW